MELVKRAGASIFLNTYVTREDAIYLNLAIRKAALGLEVASDAFQSTIADIDVDEVLGQTAIPGLSELAHVATLSMSVGASGVRQIGNFIEHTANDLLQGVMAAGILYYHGMALAAECLSLDEEHRRDPEMTRTIAQAMTMACAPAGRLLRDRGCTDPAKHRNNTHAHHSGACATHQKPRPPAQNMAPTKRKNT